jgi:hypothetical protein
MVVPCSFLTTFTTTTTITITTPTTTTIFFDMLSFARHDATFHIPRIFPPLNVCCYDAFSFSVSDPAIKIITVYMKFCLAHFVG